MSDFLGRFSGFVETMNAIGKIQNVIHVKPISNGVDDNDLNKNRTTLRADLHKCGLLYRSLKVLLYSMKVMGLHFDRDPTCHDLSALNRNPDGVVPASRWRPGATRVYSTCVLVVLWINWIRLLTAFSPADVIGTELFFKFLGFVWVGLCTVQGTVMFRGSVRYASGFAGLCIRWSALQNEYCGGEPKALSYVSRRATLFTAVAWIVAFIHFSVVAYSCYQLDFFDVLITPVSRTDPRANVFIGLFLVVHMYVTCACTHPIALFFVLCIVVYKEFMNMRVAMKRVVDKNGQFHGDFEYFRKWHHAICELTDHLDDIISIMTAAILISCILFICLILYALIWFQAVIKQNVIILLIYVFWLLMSLVIILLAAIGGAMINHAVSRSFWGISLLGNLF